MTRKFIQMTATFYPTDEAGAKSVLGVWAACANIANQDPQNAVEITSSADLAHLLPDAPKTIQGGN